MLWAIFVILLVLWLRFLTTEQDDEERINLKRKK